MRESGRAARSARIRFPKAWQADQDEVHPEVIGDIDSGKMGFPRDEPSLPA